MSAEIGIKETREVILFGKIFLVFLAQRLSDGAGLDDLIALGSKILADDEFQFLAAQAWNDSELIGSEVKDLNASEIGVLGKDALDLVTEVIEAFQKS